jgi:hypothetical protein
MWNFSILKNMLDIHNMNHLKKIAIDWRAKESLPTLQLDVEHFSTSEVEP